MPGEAFAAVPIEALPQRLLRITALPVTDVAVDPVINLVGAHVWSPLVMVRWRAGFFATAVPCVADITNSNRRASNMVAGDRAANRPVILCTRIEPGCVAVVIGKDPDQVRPLVLAVRRAAIVVVIVPIIAGLHPLSNDAVAT